MKTEAALLEPLDVKRITAAVAARHGVLLKPDDPAMVLVTINECVLEKCFERLELRARALIAELDATVAAIEQRGSARLADQVREAGREIREQIGRDIEAAKLEASEAVFKIRASYSQNVVRRWIAVGVVCAVALLIFGVVLGRVL
jgi:CHASE3 domain sensor protein